MKLAVVFLNKIEFLDDILAAFLEADFIRPIEVSELLGVLGAVS